MFIRIGIILNLSKKERCNIMGIKNIIDIYKINKEIKKVNKEIKKMDEEIQKKKDEIEDSYKKLDIINKMNCH